MKSQTLDYYETLQLKKSASQQEIKQAYKRLALIFHPDKNQGAEHAKVKFREISEAYTVLNDPKKRDNYDKYGVADLQGIDLDEFMGSFGEFQDFLTEILSFNNFDSMFSGVNKKSKKGPKGRTGRAKGKQKGPTNSELNQLADLMMGGGMGGMGFGDMMGGLDDMMGSSVQMAMLQAMLGQGLLDAQDMKAMQKELSKMGLDVGNEDDEQEEDEDLTQQEMDILAFGEKNIQKSKVGNKKKKKTEIKCKICSCKVEEDEILMHFSENHMKQFKQSQKTQPVQSNQHKQSNQN